MKIEAHGICGCLLLICAIGLAVGVCASMANSKMPLSDNEMRSVYGGCGPCDPKGTQGCSSESNYTCAERYQKTGDCSGLYRTGCKTDEKECKNQNQTTCTPTTPPCPGSYDIYDCVLESDQCVKKERMLGRACSYGGQTYADCE